MKAIDVIPKLFNQHAKLKRVVFSEQLHREYTEHAKSGKALPPEMAKAKIEKAAIRDGSNTILLLIELPMFGEVWRAHNLDAGTTVNVTNIAGSRWGKFVEK